MKTQRATRGDLSKLTNYYFDTNNPKEINIELTKEMAEEAINIAKELNDWVDMLLQRK